MILFSLANKLYATRLFLLSGRIKMAVYNRQQIAVQFDKSETLLLIMKEMFYVFL